MFKRFKQNKLKFILLIVTAGILLLSSTYMLYSLYILKGIENLIRLIIGIVIFIILVLLLIFIFKSLKKDKSKYYIIMTISIIYSSILLVIGYYINKTYSTVNNITTKYTTHSSSLITLSTSKINDINSLDNGTIGMIGDEENDIGYIIPNKVIEDKKISNKVVFYDNYIDLIKALYNGDVSYAFVPSNYTILFKNIDEAELTDIQEKTKIIYTEEVKSKNEVSNKNIINEPFTVLLMGVDSENEDIANSSFNGDSLVLITFNPKTLNSTILSIPRDTYVPITCFNQKRKNKITHAAWYGESCMMNTISNFTGIKIDYYVKINFKGVVKLVDSLGGVEVDVPYSFCEQNSNREFGNNTVYVEKGLQTLNGEQALALARNRHSWPQYCSKKWTNYESNDFVRGSNQQKIIKAMLGKLKNIKSIDAVYEILNTISNSMETNMSTDEILSFYNIGKDILKKSKNSTDDNIIELQKLTLSGYSAMIYDYSSINNQGMKLVLYNYVPYQGSIKEITKAMKINLGLEEYKMDKTFSFSINTPYESKNIGAGNYNEKGVELLPDFIGSNKSVAEAYCKKNGIALNYVYKTVNDKSYTVGQILDQSIPAKADIEFLSKTKGITITVVEKVIVEEVTTETETEENTKINCSLKENKDDKGCLLPSFIGKTYEYTKDWFNQKKSYSINLTFVELTKDDKKCNEDNAGKVISQSKATSLYEIVNNDFVVTYCPVITNSSEENDSEENQNSEENEENNNSETNTDN